MESLKNIIKEIKSYDFINASDDMILDCSTRIFNTGKINPEPIESKQDNKPSEKQITQLKKFKVENIDKLSKEKAFEILGKMFKKTK